MLRPIDLALHSVREHAIMMGMLLPEDEPYLWIAEESLLAPLPEGKPASAGCQY